MPHGVIDCVLCTLVVSTIVSVSESGIREAGKESSGRRGRRVGYVFLFKGISVCCFRMFFELM